MKVNQILIDNPESNYNAVISKLQQNESTNQMKSRLFYGYANMFLKDNKFELVNSPI